MTEEVQVAEQQPEVEVGEVDYKKFYEEHKNILADYPGLVKKNKELLAEAKEAKDAKRRQAEEAEKARQEQLSVAQKNGEFEKLWKSAEEEKEKYKSALDNYQRELKEQAINVKAEKIALDLSNKDPSKAELLRHFVANSLSKLADDKGHLDDEVLSSVKHQFETDKKFAVLLGSNLSNGGSAPGNTRSASVSSTVTRAEFDKMSFEKQHAFIEKVKKGQAQLTDN